VPIEGPKPEPTLMLSIESPSGVGISLIDGTPKELVFSTLLIRVRESGRISTHNMVAKWFVEFPKSDEITGFGIHQKNLGELAMNLK